MSVIPAFDPKWPVAAGRLRGFLRGPSPLGTRRWFQRQQVNLGLGLAVTADRQPGDPYATTLAIGRQRDLRGRLLRRRQGPPQRHRRLFRLLIGRPEKRRTRPAAQFVRPVLGVDVGSGDTVTSAIPRSNCRCGIATAWNSTRTYRTSGWAAAYETSSATSWSSPQHSANRAGTESREAS